jgi:hypothetical protein
MAVVARAGKGMLMTESAAIICLRFRAALTGKYVLAVGVVLTACAPTPAPICAKAIVRPPMTVAPVSLSGICAEASIVVRPEKGSHQYGLDPIETQRLILLSRTFRTALVKAEPTLATLRYQITRAGKSGILRLRAGERNEKLAMRACEVLTRIAVGKGDAVTESDIAAKSWLAEQRKSQQKRQVHADRKLEAFRKEHDLIALSVADLISLRSDTLKRLMSTKSKGLKGKRGLVIQEAIRTSRSELFRLSRLESLHKRLKRQADVETQLLAEIVKREGTLGIESLKDRRLLLLERCAPIECK